jgi:chitinase
VGWYYDEEFIIPAIKINISTYNNEKLYALYEPIKEDVIASFVITKYNFHETTYDDLAIFDSSQSGFTSLYWHKIGVKKINNEYYISSIAVSGEKVTSMTYDYVILAYSYYSRYGEFASLDVKVGDKVIFDCDLELLSGKDVNVTMSFVSVDNSSVLVNIKEELENLYNEYQELNEDIELITESNGVLITWKSSNNDIISSTGIYHKPNVTTDVTLSAYVNNELIYSFTVSVIGNSDHYDALATGYIYTPYTITQNAMNTLDIIYCAFLDIDRDANFTNATSMKNKINTYILPLAEISGTKVVISVNQGSSGAFSAVAAREALREKLATNILNFIIEMNIHGIDIDWETPASNEATNFTLLMKSIYEKVKKYNSNLLVTAAIGGGKWQPPKYDLPHSKDYLDYVNLMTYSMATGNGYYQNALYKSSKGATLTSCSIDESIDLYNSYGVTNDKILIGIPFYTTVQTGCEGPGSKVGSGKSIWYKELFSTYKLSDTMKEYFDEECGVPYRYDAVNKIFISFDNEQSIKVKCEYIHAKGLAGIMYWQYGQDVDDMLSNAIAKYIDS